MEPEIIIGVLAIFVSGGAMGAAGALLGQWVLRRVSPSPTRQMGSSNPREMELLKAEVADMATRLHSVDTRLDFTEQLLGGALLGSPAPEPLPPPGSGAAADTDDSDPGGRSDPR
jgi:hypothetical protein